VVTKYKKSIFEKSHPAERDLVQQPVSFNHKKKNNMKKIFSILISLAFLTSCLSSKKTIKDNYLKLAEKLIEGNDYEQISNFSRKLDTYYKNPESVFDGKEYYYDTKNSEFQAYRGDSEELTKNAEWFLLIDNLKFGKYLWEFDWESDYKELVAVLKILAQRKNYNLPDLAPENEIKGKNLDEVFPEFNSMLSENNLVLINLYIDSDSYVTGLIKKKNLSEIIIIAEKLGHKIKEYK
jgi:hypothetical protein